MADEAPAMRIQIMLPERVLRNARATKVVAEAPNGAFGLLPRHIDFVAPLVPSILSYVDAETDEEVFVAVDEGVLVKYGKEVLVSVRNAAVGLELGLLEETVRERFERVDEREQAMRSALAKLESEVVRRFSDTQ